MSRFVLLYKGAHDPSRQEESSVLSALKKFKVVDQTPGSILVEGAEADLTPVIQKHRKWTLSPVQALAASPPHKRVKFPAY